MTVGDCESMSNKSKALLKDCIEKDSLLYEGEFTSDFCVAEECGKGKVWLAGDALHCYSPIGGRGMNLGIADGFAVNSSVAFQRRL